MRFRDFEVFNKSILAKQAWRMMQSPDALRNRVLKGIYFPHCSFLEAKKGARASWCWSSFLEGRDFIREFGLW